MELNHVFLDTTGADDTPEFHSRFAGKRDEVSRQVIDVTVRKLTLADLFCIDLLNHSAVLVEREGSQGFHPFAVEKLLDRDNPLVVLSIVVESDSSLEADKALSQVEHGGTSVHFLGVDQHIVETLPATTTRVALVRLDVTSMLKVSTVLIDEVPDQGVYIFFSPSEPILNGRLKIPNAPAIKLSRIHLVDLIALAMLTAVDGSEDQSVGMKVMTVQLAAVSQFENPLTDFQGRAINLIKEKADRLFASNLEPVRRVEGCTIARDAGKTDKIS